MIEIATIEIMS